MMFLAVNYHYIGDEAEYARGIYPVSPERFMRQMEALARGLTFVSQRDLLDALDGKRSLPERACLITFDDSLRGQYEAALPLLDRMGIPAIFFINGLPYAERRALQIHKVHWLRAHREPEALLEDIAREFREVTGRVFDRASYPVSDAALAERYQYGDRAENRLKHLLYAGLPPATRTAIIEKIFAQVAGDERDFCRRWYISEEGLKDLARRDFLGIHGYAHEAIGAMDGDGQEREIRQCREVVARVVGSDTGFAAISYPYGTADAADDAAVQRAASLGLRMGFTMERAINRSLTDPLRFARADANDIPEGKHPLFTTDGGDVRIIDNRFASHRAVEKNANYVV